MMSGWILLLAPLACIAMMGACAWMMLRMHQRAHHNSPERTGDSSAATH